LVELPRLQWRAWCQRSLVEMLRRWTVVLLLLLGVRRRWRWQQVWRRLWLSPQQAERRLQ
jgi:hypothetical protein